MVSSSTLLWRPECGVTGTEARKVQVFSRFHAQTSGILLEIEGDSCINEEEGYVTSYIHLKKSGEDKRIWSCDAKISFYYNSADAAENKESRGFNNHFTKTSCPAFAPSERDKMRNLVRTSAVIHLTTSSAKHRTISRSEVLL